MKKSFVIILIVGLSSCVSTQKFNDLNLKYEKSLEERKTMENTLQAMQQTNLTLKKQAFNLGEENEKLRQESENFNQAATNKIENIQGKYSQLNQSYRELLKSQMNSQLSLVQKDSILKNIELDLIELEEKMDNAQKDVQRKNQIIALRDSSIKQANLYILDLEEDIASQDKLLKDRDLEVKELNKKFIHLRDSVAMATKQQDSIANQLAIELTETLKDYKKSELEISTHNNYIFLVLYDSFLFDKMEKKVDVEGKDVLKSVAEVIKKQTDVSVQVENSQDRNTATNTKRNLIINHLEQEGIEDIFKKRNFTSFFNIKPQNSSENKTIITLKVK